MSRSGLVCSEHPDTPLIDDGRAGDMICPACGLVVGSRVVDVGSEWRTFGDSDRDPSRVGAAENPLLENDLTTTIGRSTTGTEYHNRSAMSSTNRTLLAAFREISDLADRVGIPRVVTDQASGIFKQVHEQRRLRNRPRSAITTACLYIACRTQHATRSFKELSALTHVPARDIAKCFKYIIKTVENRNMSVHVDSSDFMSRFCSRLNLPADIEQLATHIASEARERSITDGRNPTSIAAAAIYMASQISESKRTHKEISEIAGCAESTIKHSYRLMYSRANDLIPSDSPFYTKISELPPA